MYAFHLFVSVLVLLGQKIYGQSDYRLPMKIFPKHYNVELTIPGEEFKEFSGVVDISLDVRSVTKEIVLHAFPSLIISNSSVTLTSTGTALPISIRRDNERAFLIISTTSDLIVGTQLFLNIKYEGEIFNDQMYGLYRSFYKDATNKTVYLATTQFQPTHARRAFPCFDEPSFKATFDIAIRHERKFTAVSNMPTVAATDLPGLKLTKFDRTPEMSTYLIAFIISEFKSELSEEAIIENGINIPHKIWSRHTNQKELTRQYSVEIGPKILKSLAEFTGIPYSVKPANGNGMQKIDQFAIPDFSAGAMENWGLVTYRETGLLWHPNQSTNANKQSIAAVIAHELAHQWFGNLVTCHWWSDTFLNEGFARYFQYFTTGDVEPSWQMDRQFVVAQCQAIFQSDALSTSQPLSFNANTPSEVSSRFGSISYNKGACIIRMVETILGSERFRNGLQNYLNAYKWKSTNVKNLIDHWQATIDRGNILPASLPLEKVISNWIEKPGFPLLTVEAHGADLHITQKRYISSGTVKENTTWYVPVSFSTSSDFNKFQNVTPTHWFNADQDALHISNVLDDNDAWVILNNQQRGYYRVDYDDNLWDRISNALAKPGFDDIHEINRAQLIDDIFNLAKIGRYDYNKVFDFAQFLSKDVSYYPWSAAFTSLSHMWSRTADGVIRNYLASTFINWMDLLYNSVPFNDDRNDDQVYTLKKSLVISWACRLGHEDCIKKAIAHYNNYIQNDIMPERNVKSTVYCTALRHSNNTAHWNFLWEKYLKADLFSEKIAIISALGCSKDKQVLEQYLQKSINPDPIASGIRQQDALSVFSSVYNGNPEGVDIALEFLENNHDAVAQRYGSMNSLNSLASGLAGSFTKQEQIDRFVKLAGSADVAVDLKKAIETAVVAAKSNLVWTQNFERQINALRSSASAVGISVTLVVSLILALLY